MITIVCGVKVPISKLIPLLISVDNERFDKYLEFEGMASLSRDEMDEAIDGLFELSVDLNGESFEIDGLSFTVYRFPEGPGECTMDHWIVGRWAFELCYVDVTTRESSELNSDKINAIFKPYGYGTPQLYAIPNYNN